MSETRDYLLKRKKELESKLKPYEALKNELSEINKALSVLAAPPADCEGCAGGCNICRMGPNYR